MRFLSTMAFHSGSSYVRSSRREKKQAADQSFGIEVAAGG